MSPRGYFLALSGQFTLRATALHKMIIHLIVNNHDIVEVNLIFYKKLMKIYHNYKNYPKKWFMLHEYY